MWKAKRFDELSLTELYQIYRARAQVFSEEQKIVYTDPDEQDKVAIHLFETDGTEITAYARIFLAEPHVTFGRVLTTKKVRGTGKGKELLQQILHQIQLNFPKHPIEIDAQFYAVDYYEKAGFFKVGDPFMEAGVKHIKMKK